VPVVVVVVDLLPIATVPWPIQLPATWLVLLLVFVWTSEQLLLVPKRA
jgi:hypothetical protein